MSPELVTLVDRNGEKTGQTEKLTAHQNGGQLHLAFSVFVFNSGSELLLQKRASGKYHFADLWSNTCCGHPRPDERITEAAQRRLQEEFGFSTKLHPRFSLIYEAHDRVSGFTEKEFLHILVGHFDGNPSPNPSEIGEWGWRPLQSLRQEYAADPRSYTPWFRILLPRVLASHEAVGRPES